MPLHICEGKWLHHAVDGYLQNRLNPTITYNAHKEPLSPQNAEDIVSQYDLVLDCTDHPTSRYLISDICVLLSKPLVSASAFQTSGQLIVLNNPPGVGPCYRCVFPRPPPPESVVGCGEGGIVGPVVGVMGVLQALEAIKLIARGLAESVNQMLLFSGMSDSAPFRSIRMRGKRNDCISCSSAATITLDYLKTSMDYVKFCGVAKPVNLLAPESRITAQQYDKLQQGGQEHVLVDVRPRELFSLASIPGSINVPLSDFSRNNGLEALLAEVKDAKPVYLVCRVGNDSQVAAAKLQEMGVQGRDISGGLRSWKSTVDASLPFL